MEHLLFNDKKYFGERGLKKIQESVSASIINKIRTEKFAEKHYSVNLQANIF
jgi:hypothetical protein